MDSDHTLQALQAHPSLCPSSDARVVVRDFNEAMRLKPPVRETPPPAEGGPTAPGGRDGWLAAVFPKRQADAKTAAETKAAQDAEHIALLEARIATLEGAKAQTGAAS